MDYIFHIAIMINIYIILSISTSLLLGFANLLSLCQAALYGIGAYLSVLALMVFHWPLLPALLFVMLSTAALSLLVAYPSLRLRGDYFVLATLGFQLIVYTVLYNWVTITKGPYGIPGITAPKLFGSIEISGIIPFLILSTILAVMTIFLFYKLIHSPFGRALKAVRDDKLSTMALDRNTAALKIWAFAISSAFIAISGFLYASYISYINPNSFTLDEAIFILAAVIIGGSGNIKGPVLGAIIVVVLPEVLRFVGLPGAQAANLCQIIYGVAIIVLIRLRPQGLAGEYRLK